MNHNTTNGPLLKFQMGSDRAVETNDARDNWSSNGSDQRGYTKHHQVPWFTLKKIMNHALLKLQNDQNQKLWGKIIKAAYVGGKAGSNLAPLKKTTKWLGSSPNMGGVGLLSTWNANPTMPMAHQNAINNLGSHFCWMPGNFFLGPTPTNRLDDPGMDGYDSAPNGKGGRLPTALLNLENATRQNEWDNVASYLDEIFKLGCAKKGQVINYKATDWIISLLQGTHENRFKKK